MEQVKIVIYNRKKLKKNIIYRLGVAGLEIRVRCYEYWRLVCVIYVAFNFFHGYTNMYT